MAPQPRNEGRVYRRGGLTAKQFTPRLEKDTVGCPGQAPGLSTAERLRRGQKGQVLDLALLQPPLQALADDPREGGSPGHVAIVPVDDQGNVDRAALEEWAASRDAVVVHGFTQIVLASVVEQDVEGPT